MSDHLQLNPAALLEVQTAGEDLVERVTWLSLLGDRPYRFSLF